MKKKFRIKKPDEIKELLEARNVKRNAYFSVYKGPGKKGRFRYAISVPQKFGKAVRRNKVKRQLRMIIKDLDIHENIDLFVIVHARSAQLCFQELEKELVKLVKRHRIKYCNREVRR